MFHDAGPDAAGRKVLLATTAYDNPAASYTCSIQRSREALREAGIQSGYLLLSGNCHVDDARNAVVREFLASDCTDLVFLDADVSWKPEDLVTLCRYDLDLVGGVYPYRRENVRNTLPFRPFPDRLNPDEDGLLEVQGLPAGFMRIRRAVFEALKPHVRSYVDNEGRTVWLFFERVLEDGTRWGGDLTFCNRWRAIGGKLFAAAELRLSHAGKVILTDSPAAWCRRINGTTLRHVARLIREGRESLGALQEACEAVGNPWGAQEDVLTACVLLARQAKGPIIEAGSGLTTVLMAAATDQTVYCLEHSEHFADQLDGMAKSAGVDNIGLCLCPLKDGWYDLSAFPDLPERFALGLNDGPPRVLGDRMRFFDVFGDRTGAIVADDADDPDYAGKIKAWAESRGRETRIDDRVAVVAEAK